MNDIDYKLFYNILDKIYSNIREIAFPFESYHLLCDDSDEEN